MLEIEGNTILGRLIDTLRPLVPRIHVVIGYREELIIDLCARRYRDVVLVRNPEFRTTNTAQSMALGASAGRGKTLFLDGDLLVTPESLHRFVARAADHPLAMGIAATRSENAVCVRASKSAGEGELVVESFTRDERLEYEWANVFAGPANFIAGATGFVFSRLERHVPVPAFELDLREIDTVADLEDARAFAKTLSAPPAA
jgi:choline kinase